MAISTQDYALLAIDSYRYLNQSDPGIPEGVVFAPLLVAEGTYYAAQLDSANWERVPEGELSAGTGLSG